ncbi:MULTISPECIES: aminotransferase class V-fold PLP-dependent enzyme [Rhodobacterales]|jgi:aspartate aminotransferase-like enzyme|uniref:aminotransferase class V-fold PLP-dependent enzyme n=1 Tax=Rhodobacterales TaxID=204455 RepID=UPI00237F307A|nr:aminotransferase class V-fold PLP-dependent enzyme [Phaeobacter gallaeciensis]MDE4140593.1 aminotransferase class V-fold PLP-dependent enzyme [Phaeobacter gallaeciensis]MDE4148714.1 aminotransferase class V-fold PLP-dependent enzyme [Phaeobacter gallaeciensis]MDE4152936.1 aminotransferase class V-fold PLP-dependent enzyme [Phaeobacter gallaeciensis]MDE4228650.1 aminotransferase class V-fold PLP-dependent enzyme [Phaeobacter gallaeciensis]MDE4257726.1 aminotransferase class V-fold PLP-depend
MALLDTVDPKGLDEFSVVFTDRSLNHMSKAFQQVMLDISDMLKEVYSAEAVALVPGGGTFAMEAVARQFARGANALVVRNGWFSYRWSQIFESGGFTASSTVMKARQTGNSTPSPFTPAPIEEVVQAIREQKPDIVFAPHVETSAGVILPDGYVTAMAAAAHEVGALMVLDCIASGCAWVDMKATGVDVLISAPQKGWSASPSAGLVMFSEAALKRLEETTSDSFAINLKQWRAIMKAYEDGGHAYHATMPTDALRAFRDTMLETREYGFDRLRDAQWQLGNGVRAYLKDKGVVSVAAEGFGAPGVVVSYTSDPEIQNGKKFLALGMQIAAGVPLQCDEPDDFRTFRLGLFGLDKLYDVEGTLKRLTSVLDQVL